VSIERRTEKTLKAMIEFLNSKYELKLRVDEDAFRRAGTDQVNDKPIRLKQMLDIPLAFVLELMARQVGGTVRAEKNQVLIVPGHRELASVLRPAGDRLMEKLAEKVTIEKAINNAPLGDILEYFGDKYELTIVVDEWSFPKTDPAGNVVDTPCSVPAGTQPLREWLEQCAKQVNGQVVPLSHLILIERQTKDVASGRSGGVDLAVEVERRKAEVENLQRLLVAKEQKIVEIDQQMAKLRDESVQSRIQWEQARDRNADLLRQVEALTREVAQLRSLLGGAAPKGPQEPASGESRVKALQKERLAIFREAAEQAKSLYRAKAASSLDVAAADRNVLQAALELCESDRERVVVLEKLVALEKQCEETFSQLVKSKAGSQADLLKVRATRLEAEIALEKAKARLAVPAK
jgi:hypothetical protein